VIAAPVVLGCTTAINLLAGIRVRLNDVFEAAQRAGDNIVLVFTSDSAKACRKLFRLAVKQREFWYLLHSRCMMHQLFLCMSHFHKPLEQLAPLFCASCLVHRGSVFDAFIRNIEVVLGTYVRITTEAPSDTAVRYTDAVVDFLRWEQSVVNPEGHRIFPPSFQEGCDLFRRMFVGNMWEKVGPGNFIYHYCPFGCCSSKDDTVRKMMNALNMTVFRQMPSIPALNRWTQLLPPIRWWATTMLVYGVGPVAWQRMRQTHREEEGELHADLFVGPGENDTVVRVNMSRSDKTTKWLSADSSKHRMLIMALILRGANDLMGDSFDKSARDQVSRFARTWPNFNRTPDYVFLVSPRDVGVAKLAEWAANAL
jgi:hypothetical protein